jgi:hypothetical protein
MKQPFYDAQDRRDEKLKAHYARRREQQRAARKKYKEEKIRHELLKMMPDMNEVNV